ncbi:MAG: helix-turn-helix domain-containing protein [Chitinophagales bacterium]|nr:helix-turn-helix domain-containing protein [Chitinophagales bacterium]
MQVICMEDTAFYALIDDVVKRIKEQQQIKEDKWISGEEAMKKLRITSKTTLQKLRDEGRIRFSQPDKRVILYDVESIYQYLEKHAKR